MSDREPDKALARLVGASQALEALLECLADGSPYLWDLASSDPARFLALLEAEPDQHLHSLLAHTRRAAAQADGTEVMRLLRRMKAEAALLIALADIGGVWPLSRITGSLTAVAETALGVAVRSLLADLVEQGRLNPHDAARPEAGSGYSVLAMGKMGAHELNYSSDVDLIVFFDPATPALAGGVEAAPLFVRLTRGLVRLLQERTADGLCVSRRSAAASRSGLNADRDLAVGCARLL
jgi:glutamate-ammonia-ligase adenylyltransferase